MPLKTLLSLLKMTKYTKIIYLRSRITLDSLFFLAFFGVFTGENNFKHLVSFLASTARFNLGQFVTGKKTIIFI